MIESDKHETRDEVLRETRRIKETLAESMDFDIARMLNDARKRQSDGDRTILLPPVQQNA